MVRTRSSLNFSFTTAGSTPAYGLPAPTARATAAKELGESSSASAVSFNAGDPVATAVPAVVVVEVD